MEEQRLVQVYTGNGKGKTTAALGQATRMLGHGYKVAVLQFFKSELSGEVAPLEKLGVKFALGSSQDKPTWTMNQDEQAILHRDSQKLWEVFRYIMKNKAADLIILDEINHALHREYLSKEQVLEAFAAPLCSEIICTGRNAPDWLIERADLVTEMKMRKHPFEQGIPERLGIEK